MNKIFKFVLVAIFPVYFSTSLSAELLVDPPASIKIAMKNGIELINHFTVPNGVDGWVVKNRSGYNVWYSDKEGYVFVGAYLDPAGNNLTPKFLKEFTPQVDYGKIMERVVSIDANPLKPSDRPVYVFYEPYCGYCSAFHAAAKPYVDAGADVRWVPVAFLKQVATAGKPSSFELMAAIMSAPDPLAMVDAHEASKADGTGGLTVGVKPDVELFKIAEGNSSVMNELGFSGTPAIAYVDESGDFKLVKGFPGLDKLGGIFGMPRRDSADSRLVRFGAKPGQYPVER